MSMLSPLSRGCGTWDGGLLERGKEKQVKETLTSLDPFDDVTHRHGITVSPRMPSMRLATATYRTGEKPDGELLLPKTFTTRKGALVLFTPSGQELSLSPSQQSQLRKNFGLKADQVDVSAKFGSLTRFAHSVLTFGDQQDYPHDSASISDSDNKVFLKFLRRINDADLQTAPTPRPGSDVTSCVRQLRVASAKLSSNRARSAQPGGRYGAPHPGGEGMRAYPDLSRWLDTEKITADSAALVEQATRPPTAQTRYADDRSPTPRSYPVLSSEKLTASLRSVHSYLGRYTAPEQDTLPGTLNYDFDRSQTLPVNLKLNKSYRQQQPGRLSSATTSRPHSTRSRGSARSVRTNGEAEDHERLGAPPRGWSASPGDGASVYSVDIQRSESQLLEEDETPSRHPSFSVSRHDDVTPGEDLERSDTVLSGPEEYEQLSEEASKYKPPAENQDTNKPNSTQAPEPEPEPGERLQSEGEPITQPHSDVEFAPEPEIIPDSISESIVPEGTAGVATDGSEARRLSAASRPLTSVSGPSAPSAGGVQLTPVTSGEKKAAPKEPLSTEELMATLLQQAASQPKASKSTTKTKKPSKGKSKGGKKSEDLASASVADIQKAEGGVDDTAIKSAVEEEPADNPEQPSADPPAATADPDLLPQPSSSNLKEKKSKKDRKGTKASSGDNDPESQDKPSTEEDDKKALRDVQEDADTSSGGGRTPRKEKKEKKKKPPLEPTEEEIREKVKQKEEKEEEGKQDKQALEAELQQVSREAQGARVAEQQVAANQKVATKDETKRKTDTTKKKEAKHKPVDIGRRKPPHADAARGKAAGGRDKSKGAGDGKGAAAHVDKGKVEGKAGVAPKEAAKEEKKGDQAEAEKTAAADGDKTETPAVPGTGTKDLEDHMQPDLEAENTQLRRLEQQQKRLLEHRLFQTVNKKKEPEPYWNSHNTERQQRLEEEHRKREEERKIQEEEEKRKAAERQAEEELRAEQARVEGEARRKLLLERREVNLERRSNLHGMRQSQNVNHAWAFSYYVMWPRESFQKFGSSIVSDEPKRKKQNVKFNKKAKT